MPNLPFGVIFCKLYNELLEDFGQLLRRMTIGKKRNVLIQPLTAIVWMSWQLHTRCNLYMRNENANLIRKNLDGSFKTTNLLLHQHIQSSFPSSSISMQEPPTESRTIVVLPDFHNHGGQIPLFATERFCLFCFGRLLADFPRKHDVWRLRHQCCRIKGE